MKLLEKIICDDCLNVLNIGEIKNIHLTIFDPPFNQGKEYEYHDDNMETEEYWEWIEEILTRIYELTEEGGAIYFMHREKNVGKIFNLMQKIGWTYRNLIIWRKMSKSPPITNAFSKRYQIIFYGIKGNRPRVFNQLHCDAPMVSWHKIPYRRGISVDDVWYDIRELTSGFLGGNEVIRETNGHKVHLQQMPLSLPARMILTSTMPGDLVLDPTAGTGTSLIAAKQLNRSAIAIDIDPKNCEVIRKRLPIAKYDNIDNLYYDYRFTPEIDKIWGQRKQQKLAWL